tara:strand:+ start:116 stop:277 length:162 start_codon:yes stop_codon:yes gene_type:complete
MVRSIFCVLVFVVLIACSGSYDEELYRTGKSSAAQGRLGASQAGAQSVFSDVD